MRPSASDAASVAQHSDVVFAVSYASADGSTRASSVQFTRFADDQTHQSVMRNSAAPAAPRARALSAAHGCDGSPAALQSCVAYSSTRPGSLGHTCMCGSAMPTPGTIGLAARAARSTSGSTAARMMASSDPRDPG